MNDLHAEVGRLSGRLEALEARADRNEKAVWGELKSMDTKLDNILSQLAESVGVRKGRSFLVHAAHILATIAAAVGTWFGATHR